MAYFINPDGTISPIDSEELRYDKSGAVIGIKPNTDSAVNPPKIEKKKKRSVFVPNQEVLHIDKSKARGKTHKKTKSKSLSSTEFNNFYKSLTDKEKEELKIYGRITSSRKKKKRKKSSSISKNQDYKPFIAEEKPEHVRSRHPQYGYARDRFGRILEKDHYIEDGHNEFTKSKNFQKNYDYSSYDDQDDNDGAYDGWE